MDLQQTRRNAARLIAAKALRITIRPGTAQDESLRKQQRRAALLQLAAELSPDLAQEIAAVSDASSSAVAIMPADRHAAATEVYSLALRRAEGTAAHQQEALQAYDIALALHYESYWAYSKGLLLQDLGETDAACATLEAVQGYYEASAKQVAQQFRLQAAGEQDPFEAAAQQLYDSMTQNAGGESALKGMFKDLLQPLSDAPDSVWNDDDDDVMEDARDDVDMDARDLAAQIALQFAERLADNDFAGAKALLGSSMAATSAKDLREQFENMIALGREIAADDGEDTGSLLEEMEIFVQSVESDPFDDIEDSLGRVYVVVNGPDFDEALIVAVAREDGEPRIQEVEWGRM